MAGRAGASSWWQSRLLVVVATLAMLWQRRLAGVASTTTATEARAPLTALLHGHIWTFLSTAPPYGPSLVLRAPFALARFARRRRPAADLPFRRAAMPACAGRTCACWIAPQLRGARWRWFAVLLTLAVCVANPITYYALAIGHPEEALGAVLCVAAVVVAVRGHATLAGLLLGLAIANKEWAVVATRPGACRPAGSALAGDADGRRSPCCHARPDRDRVRHGESREQPPDRQRRRHDLLPAVRSGGSLELPATGSHQWPASCSTASGCRRPGSRVAHIS